MSDWAVQRSGLEAEDSSAKWRLELSGRVGSMTTLDCSEPASEERGGKGGVPVRG